MKNYQKFINSNCTLMLDSEEFAIRTMKHEDIQTLRVWKNNNKEYFHLKTDITPEQQEKWFDSFKDNPLQEMFILKKGSELIACVGFRKKSLESHDAELFNLILGVDRYKGAGLMNLFFEKCRNVLQDAGIKSISLVVLKTNSVAISWYKKQGFVEIDSDKSADHIPMRLSVKDKYKCVE